MSEAKFLDFLVADCGVVQATVKPVNVPKNTDLKSYKPINRYLVGEVSPYVLALSFAPGSYLSHASAMVVHALTEQAPKTIYVNKEQSPKPENVGGLTQEGIDRAFKNKPRMSNYVFAFDDYRFVRLNGKNTGRLEVSTFPLGTDRVDATKLERTLIDIVVRPAYAGGPFEVLKAYQAARDRAVVNVLIATLKRMAYTYPYHQAIGFFMERAGYHQRDLQKVASIGLNFDFYVDNAMKDPSYDKRWRVHFPKGL